MRNARLDEAQSTNKIAEEVSITSDMQMASHLWQPCPSLGDLPHPGMEPVSPAAPALQADSLPLSHCGSPLAHSRYTTNICSMNE